jgi:hypothetical protein
VDAAPLLERIARALNEAKLDAILIGNAGAALHGAPVTTLDFDFFFRDTASNRKKLVVFARELGAIVLRPYYPASSLFRVTDDDLTLQTDFMGTIHGLRSYEGVKKRAAVVIDRKTAPCSPCSRQRSMRSGRKPNRRRTKLDALRRENDREMAELIQRLLAKPMHERTHFLRRRLPGGSSAL